MSAESAKPELSVVIPVYNSEATLPALIAELAPELARIARGFEIILVNDGSRDGSWTIVERLEREHAFVRGIDLMRNYGQHNALLAGIRAARYDVIVTMDDDLQHPPKEIARLLQKLDEGFDVVYGAPSTEQHGFLRNLASRITKFVLSRGMGAVARQVSAFRAFRTPLRDAFADNRGSFVSIDVLLTWGTSRFSAVTVEHHARRAGQSNYTVGKLITHALNMLTGFTTLPLQFASMLGFALTALGFLILVYVVGRWLWIGGSVPGFPFLASTIAIFSGAQMFALGLIGEYIARIHFRLMDRPAYAVRRASARAKDGSPS